MDNKEKLSSEEMDDVSGGGVYKQSIRGKTVWIACDHDPKRPYQSRCTGKEYYRIFDNEKDARRFALQMVECNKGFPYNK